MRRDLDRGEEERGQEGRGKDGVNGSFRGNGGRRNGLCKSTRVIESTTVRTSKCMTGFD